MIPKIIHYCWFGGNPLPELAEKCMESWRKFCPDYKIIRWDESNFDFDRYPYAKGAMEAKKWAFISDVARLHALVNYGGIYMDTDVEVLRSLDELLSCRAFSGFESNESIPTGTMGAEKGHPLFVELLRDYDGQHFIQENGKYDLTTNVARITKTCLKYGLVQNNELQTVGGFTLFPKDYLCAKDPATGEFNITANTYTVHHFDGSWQTKRQKFVFQKTGLYKKYFPQKIAYRMATIQYYMTHPLCFFKDLTKTGNM